MSLWCPSGVPMASAKAGAPHRQQRTGCIMCSAQILAGQYSRLHTLGLRSSKAFKHLLTPKIWSNSSGVS